MNITPISISNVVQRTGISFAKKIESSTQDNKASGETCKNCVSPEKMLTALVALAGLTTLNSCQDDFKYREMNNLKNKYFDSLSEQEKQLSKSDEKTYVFDAQKDSLFKETDKYKYSHIRIKTPEKTTVFGNIMRKEDGKALKFINVYNKDNIIQSSTLKDPKTNDVFYAQYTNKGYLTAIHDKNGDELPSSRFGDVAGILMMAICLYGINIAKSIFMEK